MQEGHKPVCFAELLLFKDLRVNCMSRAAFMHWIQLWSLLFTCTQSSQSGDPVCLHASSMMLRHISSVMLRTYT